MRSTVLVLLFCAAFARPASATDCACRKSTLDQSLASSDLVFLGTVERVRDSLVTVADTRGKTRTRKLQAGFVRMQSIWKGTPSRQLTVFGLPQGECSAWPGFRAGETYLMFANQDPRVGVRVEPCSATAPRSESESSIAALGQPAVIQRLPALKNRQNN